MSPEEEFGVEGTKEAELLWDQSQLHYEQSVSLYDALLLNDPKVILVEIGEQRRVADEITALKIIPELNNLRK